MLRCVHKNGVYVSNDFLRLVGGVLLGLLLLAVVGSSLKSTALSDKMFKEPIVWNTAALRMVNNQKTVSDFSKYKGNWLVVYFWSTSCGQCTSELSSYNRLARNISPDAKIKFIMVSTDSNADEAFKFVAEKEYKGADSFVVSGGIIGIKPPLVLLIDPNGNVIGGHRKSVKWRDEEVLMLFQDYMTGKLPRG